MLGRFWRNPHCARIKKAAKNTLGGLLMKREKLTLVRLTLAKLLATARRAKADLFTFDFTCITGHKACLAERWL